MMMRILVLGKNGQLGWELIRTLGPLGQVVGLDLPDFDLSVPASVRQVIREIYPDIIFNAGAYTQVDRAESEPEIAMAVNGTSPGIIAETAHEIRAALIHYSTDYVFDGTKGSSYLESDAPQPLNVYGITKLAGEHAVSSTDAAFLVFRTSWVYSMRRESFVSKVLDWARQNRRLQLVSDQVSNPTWSRMLAEVSAQVLAESSADLYGWIRERHGIYHLAGDGAASRFEWGREILSLDPRKDEQVCQEILPALTSDFPSQAVRPLHSALNCELFISTFGLRLPDWRYALQLAMETSI